MRRILCFVALCAVGLSACGTDVSAADDSSEALVSVEQGLACETGSGYCPGTTVCAWFPGGDEGLCRPPCINGTCAISGQLCCTQPNGAPYCNTSCF
ncbi:hypothetical protein JY651_15860 [Pyxidicoccus parkwayensis]|uniref:Lipoprotein n=1 Tax=Pyxidicoccus parkwayensis TaxID=2813578 RepID=A0ABX7P748_9BACT|nr:hypothetical protein [Pyxidicoccus parkwaysis]QSQ26314.1 hypothetical protein JY651_15860 [Pyxidicoccus parkwaysis]